MAKRPQFLLGSAAAAVVILAAAAWRSTSVDTPARGAAGIPNPQLAQLLPFAKPVADSVRLPAMSSSTVVIARDPFAPQASVPAPRRATVDSTVTTRVAATPEWDVTATLIAGDRRAALINGVLVNLGEPAPGGVTLTAVERDRVVLTDPKGAAHTVAVKEGDR